MQVKSFFYFFPLLISMQITKPLENSGITECKVDNTLLKHNVSCGFQPSSFQNRLHMQHMW